MTSIGIWIVILTMSTIVVDRRYKSGYRHNARWQGWRLYLVGFGVGIALLGWFLEGDAKGPQQARSTERPKSEVTAKAAPTTPGPKRAALAGIELGSDLQALVQLGARCYEDPEAVGSGAMLCNMQAFFGGMNGPLNVQAEDGRVTLVFANDNVPEQLAALRSELSATYGTPASIEGGERWMFGDDAIDLRSLSVALHRPR